MQDSVERFLNALETEREFSANTVSAYRNDLKQFVTYLQAELSLHSWPEVQCTHLTSYTLEMREREYAVSTIARKTAAVKSFFGYLTESGELRADPSASLASPRVEKYIPRAITENEMAMLLGEPMRNSTPEAVRDFAMLHVLYSTGMRVSELMRLDIDDVDAACQRVRCTGKQGRQREIDLSPAAGAALNSYIHESRPEIARRPNESALFLNHRGSRLTRQGFWLILKQYAEQVGIKDITPHTLRHSFAAHQLTRGRDLGDVQRILGHVSISTTQVYQRLAHDLVTQSGRDGHEYSDAVSAGAETAEIAP